LKLLYNLAFPERDARLDGPFAPEAAVPRHGQDVRELKVASEPDAPLQVLENPIYGLKRIGH